MIGSNDYPPSSFYFKVAFASTAGLSDSSFSEVSGIAAEMETEPYVEGGENRFVYQLPKQVKHPMLVLKRGMAKVNSPLIIWCKSVFEGDLAMDIVVQPLTVMLMGEKKLPIRAWTFHDAFPVKWDADPFNSTKNDVAIEKIELSYSYMTRMI